MGLLNYTTNVGVHKTLGEIHEILAKHGIKKLMYDYDDDGHVQSVSFQVYTPVGDRGVRLPANADAVFKVLQNQKKSGKVKGTFDFDQAERVAWRIIKDWLEAQMAILESDMVDIEEVFFPYLLNAQGQTLFEKYREGLLLIE